MKKTLPLVIILFVFCEYSFGQKNLSSNEIELVSLGIQNSFALKEASYKLSLDSIESKTIRQNFIPTLGLDALYGYGASRINVDIPAIPLPITGIELFEGESEFNAKGSFFNTNLTAKALLFSGMQVSYGYKATEEKIKAKHFMLEKERADIIKDVIDTFDKIELLNKSKAVLEASENRLAKEKERVIKAIENGLAIPFDRDKITAAELNIASKKEELYGNLSLLFLKLSMLTDVPVSTLESYTFQLQPWILNTKNNSYNNRPELKALDASITAYDYKLKMNRSAFLPKIQAFATLSYANLFNAELETPLSLPGSDNVVLELNKFETFPSYLLGVGMHWDLFTGLKNTNETQKTNIEKNIAEEKKNDISQKLALYAKKVSVDFEVKNKQLLFKEKEKDIALNTLKIASKSYREGLISITEYLETEADYQEAILAYYKLIAQQRMAALEVLISTGSLHIENLNN